MNKYISVLLQAEEITLTIGQAFDLAYKKFLESGGKDVETRKQIGSLQKRVRLTLTSVQLICSRAHFNCICKFFNCPTDTLIFLLINAAPVSIDHFKSSSVNDEAVFMRDV